jgi:hypothetical protein
LNRNYDFTEIIADREKKTSDYEKFIDEEKRKIIEKNGKISKSTVKFNRSYLKSFISENKDLYSLMNKSVPEALGAISSDKYSKLKYDFEMLRAIYETTKLSKENAKSYLTVEYEEKESGRRYTSLGENIQGMSKELRKVLFKDYNEYDIEAAAPTYFVEIFKEILKKDTSVLKEYIEKYYDYQVKRNKVLKYSYVVDDEVYSTGREFSLKDFAELKKDNIAVDNLSVSRKNKFNENFELYMSTLKKLYETDDFLLNDFVTDSKKKYRLKFAEILKGSSLNYCEDGSLSKEDTEYLTLAKTIITMLFFGAKNDLMIIDELIEEEKSDDYFFRIDKNNALKVAINDEAMIERFYKSDFVKEFLIETKIIMSIVFDYFKNRLIEDGKKFKLNEDTILTAKKYSNKKELRKLTKSEILAFLYQNYESKNLKAIEETYKKYTKNYDYFLIHDGIYTKKEIDINLLEEAMSKIDYEFNIELKLGYEKIS